MQYDTNRAACMAKQYNRGEKQFFLITKIGFYAPMGSVIDVYFRAVGAITTKRPWPFKFFSSGRGSSLHMRRHLHALSIATVV